MNKPYCTAPWNGITVRENGDVKTCCVGSTVLGNVNKTSIIDIVAGETLDRVKQDLLNNNPSTNCSSCIQDEQRSGNSLRRHYNTYYPELTNELKFLDVRWNNLCNLYCIYCNDTFSTTWAEKLNTDNTIKIIRNGYDVELEQWILSHAHELHELMLVGGEPLLMKQNYALIKQLPDSTRLSIITNLSYDLKNNPAWAVLVNRPQDNTVWNISVDNYGQRFEYVRNGANWFQFKENIELLVANNPNNTGIAIVYGIFSGLTLLDTVQYYDSLGIKKIRLQSLFGNTALDIFSLPNSVLEKAHNQLTQTIEWRKKVYGEDYSYYASPELEELAEKLVVSITDTSRNVITKEFFINEIARYDSQHTTRFSELWPAEYELIINSFK